MTCRRLLSARLAFSLLSVAPANVAATTLDAPAAAPDAPAASAPACFPACRDGFTCHEGQCVSLCNPPCPAGLECVEGRRCEPPVPGGHGTPPFEPPPPREKAFAELSHGLLAFHWGLPGSLDVDDAPLDLDHTLGVLLRSDTPVAKYVLLGPQLEIASWRPDTSPASDHSYFVDLDLVLRLRLPITTSHLNYQLWLGMPVGFSLDVPGGPLDDAGFGWNIGVLFGGAVHFTSKFGLFAEVGWEQQRLTHARDSVPDVDLKLQQPLLNLGIIVRN